MNNRIRISYGDSKSQFCELYLPKTKCRGTVCLLHGGFWSMPYGLDQFDDVSLLLSKLGYCVWNVEYRRVGESAYQWENAFEDALAAVNELPEVKKLYSVIDLNHVYVVGHSAGGHLGLWLNTQALKVKIRKYIGLAPILDLKLAYSENAGNGAVGKLLMGSPDEYSERYIYSSPIQKRDKNGSELIIHGVGDEYVPIEWSERYCEELKKSNSYTALIKLKDCGHMDFIDTSSEALKTVVENLI